MQKIIKCTQPNATNPLPHAIDFSVLFSGVFDAGGCSYHFFFTFSAAEVPSATPQPQALQLGLRRVNERNQKALSGAIHATLSLAKIGAVVCEISSKEHKGPSSLLLKAPHVYTLDTKVILVSAVLLLLHASLLYYCTRHVLLVGGWYTTAIAVQLYHNNTC